MDVRKGVTLSVPGVPQPVSCRRTVRYFGIEVDDAIKVAEKIDI
jgi:hypothetical protein